MNKISSDTLFNQISQLIQQARQQLQRSVNTVMVQTYWQIGRLIIEHEQRGESRAAYGKQQLELLSVRLNVEFGKGFDVTNLRNMRRFYEAFPIRETVSLELSWSHYNHLSRVENSLAREWYQREAIQQGWSVRALERQIGTLYFDACYGLRRCWGEYGVRGTGVRHNVTTWCKPIHILVNALITLGASRCRR